jgi:hypothetical protein
MSVWLTCTRSVPAVEEAKQFFPIVPVRLQTSIGSFKIILFQQVGLLLEGLRCQDKMIGDYREFVEDEEVGRRYVRDE